MRAIFALPLSALLVAAQSCATLTIAPAPISKTDTFFASWNVDSSRDRLFFDIDFANPQLVYLATQIGAPGAIRFGGTGNDALFYSITPDMPPCPTTVPGKTECLNATWWNALSALSTATGAPLIFGVNIHPPLSGDSPPKAPFNATNARALLSAAKAAGQPLFGLELGNEQNTIMTAEDQAAAFGVLSGVLDDVYGPPGAAGRPLLFGPDPHSFRDAGSALPVTIKYLATFVRATKAILSYVTHHEYIEITADNVLLPSFLDTSAEIGRAVVAGVRNVSATIRVAAGEIGPHNGGTYGPGGVTPNCAGNKVCGRFGSALWYADSMSAKAAAGYSLYCRQDVIGADYGILNSTSLGPSADYWLLALWKRLVGPEVLGVAVSGGGGGTTRAYGFCASGGGAATLILINLAATSACVGLPAGFAAPGAPLTQFSLTPGAGGVASAATLLNGAPLALDAAGKLPPLNGASVPQAGGVTLPATSVTLLRVPLAPGVGTCGGR